MLNCASQIFSPGNGKERLNELTARLTGEFGGGFATAPIDRHLEALGIRSAAKRAERSAAIALGAPNVDWDTSIPDETVPVQLYQATYNLEVAR